MFENRSIVIIATSLFCIYVATMAASLSTGKQEIVDYATSTTFKNDSAGSDDLIFLETISSEKNQTYQRIVVSDVDGDDDDDGNFDNLSDEDAYDDEQSQVEPEAEADFVDANTDRGHFIDMSDFVALVPAKEVQIVVANYYDNDPETKKAFTYLRSQEFIHLKDHITTLPEIAAFLRFLNSSGLDMLGFVYTLTNLTARPDELLSANDSLPNNVVENIDFDMEQSTPTIETNKSITPPTATTMTLTATTETITAAAEATTKTTTAKTAENLNGLHGLVDSILDLLPQDQILSMFFDKMETSEEFSKLVENIGSPKFAKILQNMENSIALRNLIFTLHNNGIYITRIVDSLKAYFFLGGF